MSKLQVKRDALVIVPYTLFTLGSLAALIMGRISVEIFITILGALNVASAFGLKKDPPDPPPSPGMPLLNTPIIGLLMLLAACSSTPPPDKSVSAEAAYTAEQLACVDKAASLEDARVCRAAVRSRWALDGGAQ